MKKKLKTGKTVFIFLHNDDWRDCLKRWLDANHRTPRIEKGKGINKSVTLAISAWKRFCEYYHFPVKDL